MNTDNTMQETIDKLVEPEPPVQQPVRVKRESSIFSRLKQKQRKALNLQRAVEFAGLMISAGTRKWVAAKSLVEVHGLKVRQARAIVKQQKPRKHRARA